MVVEFWEAEEIEITAPAWLVGGMAAIPAMAPGN